MIKILIFIDWFHPAYKAGGPIQSIANMVSLFTENVCYKIFCSNADLDGTVLQVPANKWVRYNSRTEVYYASKNHLSVGLIKKEIRSCRADILFVNGIYSWYLNLMPLLFGKAGRKIISARGMLHPGALSQKSFKKKGYLFLWKLLGVHKGCSFHTSTNEEKEFIQNVFGKKTPVFVAQNFPKVIKHQIPIVKLPGSLQLVSIAVISPMKNILLILEALMACKGDIVYNIYGPVKDAEYWDKCLGKIKELPQNIIVNYHGDIPPQEVENVLAKNHLFILPSKSENFGHAFYEALSSGKPVITSNNTPWNNLSESKAGINVSTGNPDGLSDSIQYFVSMDQNEFNTWSDGANQYAVKAIDLNDIKQQYRQMFFL